MTTTGQQTVAILNGPNLNLLGSREPETYGILTLQDIEKLAQEQAEKHGLLVDFRQTNQEGTLVDWIQEADKNAHALILNAAAYTHTSVALHDAVAAISIPTIEVHLSNIFAREDYRHHSFISDVAEGVICGLGANGYRLAVDAVANLLQTR